MIEKISPKFKMKILAEVETAIWEEYKTYKKVRQYMTQWIEEYDWNTRNFNIITKGNNDEIDLSQTLTLIDDETLLKIAADIGVNTPDFIPAVAEIYNIFKVNYQTAGETFKQALNQCYEHPDNAVSLANSALESIIKHILKDSKFENFDKTKTLYDQAVDILKQFQLYPEQEMPTEIKTIGSSLLAVSRAIEQLRSEKTSSHGKLSEDRIIDDPLYASFIINSVATVGIFLINYYERKLGIKESSEPNIIEKDLPF
jgi:hypothetical protein